MDKKQLEKRLQDLGIYSDYYYRKEIKPLAQLLAEGESLNCILTGVHEGNRKMLAVTDRRLMLIFTGALVTGEVKVILPQGIRRCEFTKKLLFSSVRVEYGEDEVLVLTNVQGKQKKLFDWAMTQLKAE